MIIKTLLYYFIAYAIITLMVSGHFLFNWKVKKQEAFDASLGIKSLLSNATKFEAFETTKPYHPIYNLLVFPVISIMFMQEFSSMPSFVLCIQIGLLWMVYCVIFDILFWVVIPHPWRLTFKELFITYQPWITLAYIAIGISPLIGYIYFIYF